MNYTNLVGIRCFRRRADRGQVNARVPHKKQVAVGSEGGGEGWFLSYIPYLKKMIGTVLTVFWIQKFRS